MLSVPSGVKIDGEIYYMRILLLTQWFDPEPTFKGLAFAKELKKLGHEVEVLTGFPNYPGGRLYDGYRIRFFQREIVDGIPVLRVLLYPSHDNSPVKRIANYVSFAFSSAILGTLLTKSFDVMYVYHPPATVGLPATMISLLRRIPFVYDIQDIWPDTLSTTGMLSNNTALKIVDKWCRFLYGRASKIVVSSPGFKDVLVNRGVPKEKIEVIFNWCDESHIQPTGRDEKLARELGLAGRFNIIFAGTMGKAQALDAILEAADILVSQQSNIQFVFVGGGIDVDRLKQKIRDMRLTNVLFLPRCPISQIGKILNLADILLVHLKDDPLFKITIPSKIQGYMAVGKPILMGIRGDAVDLVERANAGIACNPEDSRSIVETAKKLFAMPHAQLKAMGDNGRKYYEKELSLSVGARKFEEIFKSVGYIR